jgi:hypothetical protein
MVKIDSPQKKIDRHRMKRGHQKLVVVFNKKKHSEIKARRNLKTVPLLAWCFPLVRRNKKIQFVMRMSKEETENRIGVQVVTSKKGRLSEVDCIYGKEVIDVLRHPQKFFFKSAKEVKGAKVWNVMKAPSTSVIMQTDLAMHDLELVGPEIECDIGVLKESVNQLLEQKGHDVIAINTHPGHHAGPTRVAGFCCINNIAVAVGLLKSRNQRLKLGVIDIDVHPGDGTQQFVEQHQGLVSKYMSIHSTAQFWNMGSDLGSNGLALKLDNKREVAARRLIDKIEGVLTTWNKDHLDIILVALGFDTLKYDPVAQLGFQMRPAHFHEVGTVFAKRPEQLLFIQEGGYDLNETASAFNYLVKGFREGRKNPMS